MHRDWKVTEEQFDVAEMGESQAASVLDQSIFPDALSTDQASSSSSSSASKENLSSLAREEFLTLVEKFGGAKTSREPEQRVSTAFCLAELNLLVPVTHSSEQSHSSLSEVHDKKHEDYKGAHSRAGQSAEGTIFKQPAPTGLKPKAHEPTAAMSQLLSSRQAEELHKAMIAYLNATGHQAAATTLRQEFNLTEETFDAETSKKYESLMEKKWTSVVRLQRKIMDLESTVASQKAELDSATPLSRRNQDPQNWLPRAPARHTLQSHRLPVTCVAFHPIFSSLASGSEDTTIKIWDWELGELERTVKGHTKAVHDVDFGGPRGGTLLASCSSDLTIKLWDPSDEYKNIRTLPGHDHSVSAVRFVPSGAAGAPASGNLLISASRDKTLKIWDVATGYCVKTYSEHGDWVRDVAPSYDGRWLFSGGNDPAARLWDASSGETKATFIGHEHVIECVALAPPASYPHLAQLAGLKKPPPAYSSAEFAASGSRDKTIRLWDTRGNLLKTLVGHDNWVRALVFHPGGKYLLSSSDDYTIRCWDLSQEGKLVKTVTDSHGHFVSCLRWAPGQIKTAPTAASGTANGETNGTTGSTASKAKKDEYAVPNENIRCVLATGSVDLNVRVFAP